MSEHGSASPHGAGPGQEGAPDPSMEDILASIRRILNEEDGKPTEAEGEPKVAEDDVLQLDEAMLVADEAVPVEVPSIAAPSMAEAVIAVPQAPEPPMPAGSVPPLPSLAEPALAVPFPTPSLVAPEAAASAAASVGALMRTLATERSTAVHRGGPTLEDLVREEMRPLLKEWLDTHLPPLVERLVRAEIERVVSRLG